MSSQLSELFNYYNKTYIDNFISSYYAKSMCDTLLADKVNSTTFNVANQQRIKVDANLEASILLKTNTLDVYNKSEVDGLITNINISNNYNKNESDTILNAKLSILNFNFHTALKNDISNV